MKQLHLCDDGSVVDLAHIIGIEIAGVSLSGVNRFSVKKLRVALAGGALLEVEDNRLIAVWQEWRQKS